MEKERKKSTSLRLDPKVLKDLKLLAVEQETSIQAIVESLVTDYIKRYKTKS
jgi:hypothetical protein